MKTMENYPNVNNKHSCNSSVPSSVSALVTTIGKEIVKASKKPGWRNHLQHTGFIPDYTSVRAGLHKLFDAGNFDDVVNLGKKLHSKGLVQLEKSDDDGETFREIAHSLEIVYFALQRSSLSDVDKMKQAIDWELADTFSLSDGLEIFWEHKFAEKDWSHVADLLIRRLNRLPYKSEDSDFYQKYIREKIICRIIYALDHAGRSNEKLDLCIREAPRTDNYERVVKMLIEAGKIDHAEVWIHKRIEAIGDKYPGILFELRRQLKEIQVRKPGLIERQL
jgi:uncharacterized Zn finger protein